MHGAYTKFALSMQVATQFAGGRKIPLSANPEWVKQVLEGVHEALGSKFVGFTPRHAMPSEPEKQLQTEAIVESLHAAYENARSMRMGANSGTTAELDMQAGHVIKFVKLSRDHLRAIQADKKALKALKIDLKKLVGEVAALEKEVAGRPKLVERLKPMHPHVDEIATLSH